MTGSVAVVLALCLGMCSAQNDAGDNELGLAAVPSNADFLRRATTRATQIGDYVYLDGGEVSQLIDGKPPGEDRPSNASKCAIFSVDVMAMKLTRLSLSEPYSLYRHVEVMEALRRHDQ